MHVQTEICCVKGDDLLFCTKYFHSDMKVSRDAIVALALSGLNVGSISKRLKFHRTSVYRILKKFTSKGNVDDEPRSGRPRSSRTKDLVKSVKSKISRNQKRLLRKMPPKPVFRRHR